MATILTCIVGTGFRGREALEAIARMEPGAEVLLERNPANQYDGNAVECWFLGVFVGFIPKQANPKIAAAMDAGERLMCTVKTGPKINGRFIAREPSVLVSWDDQP